MFSPHKRNPVFQPFLRRHGKLGGGNVSRIIISIVIIIIVIIITMVLGAGSRLMAAGYWGKKKVV